MPRKRQGSAIAVRIGESIRRARKNSGMSQAELSARVGVSYQQIQKYEYGSSEPSITRLMKIAEALDMPLGGLIGECGEHASASLPSDDEMKALSLYRKLEDKNFKTIAINVLKAISESGLTGG